MGWYRFSIGIVGSDRSPYEVINLSKYQGSLPSDDLLLELELFSAGRSTHAWRCLGAHPAKNDADVEGYLFRVWAPHAPRVTIIGDFNHWDSDATPMEQTSGGIWEAFVPHLNRYDSYQYAVYRADGSYVGKSDPYSFHTATRPNTASKIYDLNTGYTWGDQSWMTYRANQSPYTSPMNIYECHLGSWRRTGEGQFLSYRTIAEFLVPYVKEMGFTHVEFLPLTEHPLDASWGYQCTGYFAATSRFGTPDDLKYLIDQLHQAGIGVIMDWVPAQFPRDSSGLFCFDGTPTYEYADPSKGEHADRSTNCFDLTRNEVRSFLFSSAMFWLEEYHMDGLRFNSLSSMLYLDYGRRDGEWTPNIRGGKENLEAIEFFQTLNSMVSAAHPDVLMVGEESTAWPNMTHPVTEGGLGFHFKWNVGWVNDLCHYVKMDPYFRQFNHRDVTSSLMHAFSDNHILPLSHDEVVHMKGSFLGKMPGDDPMKFAGVRAFYSYLMTHPGKKLTFMGTELGQWNEWHFEHSLDWHLLDYEPNRTLKHFFKTIHGFYLTQPSLWEQDNSWQGFQWLAADERQTNTIAFVRSDKSGKALIVVCNFSPVHRSGYRVGAPYGGSWAVAFNSDAPEFGGSGLGDTASLKTEKFPHHEQAQSIVIDLPPMSCVIYRCVRKNPVRKPKETQLEEPRTEKKTPRRTTPKKAVSSEKPDTAKKRTVRRAAKKPPESES